MDETAFPMHSTHMQQLVDRRVWHTMFRWARRDLVAGSESDDMPVVAGSESDDLPELIDLSDSDDGEYLFSVVG
jgi:hypothetical protein